MFRFEVGTASTASARLRWRLFGGIWLLLLIEPLREVLNAPELLAKIAGVVLILAFCLIYLFLVPRAWDDHRYAPRVPLALGLITAALAALIGPAALGTLPFLLVAIAVARSTAFALVVTVAVAAFIVVVPQVIPAWEVAGWQWARGASIGFAGLAAVGFTGLIRSNLELRQAREEVGRLAAEGERLRIARDLHDLLGHSLTTIAVKAELAQRMVGRDVARSADEMSEVAGLARQALADAAQRGGRLPRGQCRDRAGQRARGASRGRDQRRDPACGRRRPARAERAVRLGGAGRRHKCNATQPGPAGSYQPPTEGDRDRERRRR